MISPIHEEIVQEHEPGSNSCRQDSRVQLFRNSKRFLFSRGEKIPNRSRKQSLEYKGSEIPHCHRHRPRRSLYPTFGSSVKAAQTGVDNQKKRVIHGARKEVRAMEMGANSLVHKKEPSFESPVRNGVQGRQRGAVGRQMGELLSYRGGFR